MALSPPEPVVFTKDYVKHRLLSTKNTRKGRVASLSSLIRVFLVESRIMTSACQTASSYVECPSSTSWPIGMLDTFLREVAIDYFASGHRLLCSLVLRASSLTASTNAGA